MTLDKKGLEKANWGGIFSGLFNNVRKVTPTADENMRRCAGYFSGRT